MEGKRWLVLCGYLHGRKLGIGSGSGGQFQSCDPKTPDVSLLIVTYRLMRGRRGRGWGRGGGRRGGGRGEEGEEEEKGEEKREEHEEGMNADCVAEWWKSFTMNHRWSFGVKV